MSFASADYYFFLRRYKHYVTQYVDTYAYCLMPGHFHFLVRVKDSVLESEEREGRALTPLEKAFRDFFISYAKGINRRYHRTGSLFQYKFKRKIVSDDAHQMRLVTYIHRNPIRAGLCSALVDWIYSSYRAIIGAGPTSVQRETMLDWLGGRENFIAAHQTEEGLEPEA